MGSCCPRYSVPPATDLVGVLGRIPRALGIVSVAAFPAASLPQDVEARPERAGDVLSLALEDDVGQHNDVAINRSIAESRHDSV